MKKGSCLLTMVTAILLCIGSAASAQGIDGWVGGTNPVGVWNNTKKFYMHPYAPRQEFVMPSVTYTIVTGLGEDVEQGSLVAIFPNPATDFVYVSGLSPGERITIFDNLSRKIETITVDQNGMGVAYAASWISGVYYIVGTSGTLGKFMVVK